MENSFGDRISGIQKHKSLIKSLSPFYPSAKKYLVPAAAGTLFLTGASLFSIPQPMIFRYLIDSVILNKQAKMIIWVLGLWVLISLSGRIFSMLQQYFFMVFQQKVMIDIQGRLAERVLCFPKAFFDKMQGGYIMSRITGDTSGIQWFFSGTLVQMFTQVLRFIGGLFFIFYLEWRIAVFLIIPLILLFLITRFFSMKFYVLGHQLREQSAIVTKEYQETFTNVPLIKAFASEEKMTSRIIRELKSLMSLSMRQFYINCGYDIGNSAVLGMAHVSVLAVGAYLIIKGQWTVGSLLAFQGYLGFLFGPAQYLSSVNNQIQIAKASLERVSNLFDILPEDNTGTGRKIEKLKGFVEFRNVSFSYESGCPVLKNISLSVKAGEKVAIVGISGAGKTTLLSLILRFYKPSDGEIYFDGLPASEYEVRSLRGRIGYVCQDNILISGTIMENMRLGDSDATKDEIVQAAKIAQIHDFISGLPDGYNTETGEKGAVFSEGQKQRISIARALVKNPDILIMDEPASALDGNTEASLFHDLREMAKGKTVFIVAHRLATVLDSDCILYIDNNKIAASGNHAYLLKSCEAYRKLFEHEILS